MSNLYDSAPKIEDDPLIDGHELSVSDVKPGGEPAKREDPPKRRGRPRSAKPKPGAQSADSGVEQPEDQNTAGQRVVRKKWSKVKETRLKQMAKAMPDFIREYSNEAAIAQAMNVSRDEVGEVIAGDQDLMDLMHIRAADREAILLDVIEHSAIRNGKSTDARWLLERIYPERYARKSAAAEAKKPSFSAPAAPPKKLKSVLESDDG